MTLLECQYKKQAIYAINNSIKMNLMLLGKMLDILLARSHEEKGRILLNVSSAMDDLKDEKENINGKTQFLQCFNSARGIFA